MDAIFTEQEEREIQDAIEEYANSPKVEAEGGIQDEFCKNWPAIKRVLEFLKNFPLLPAKAVAAIEAVIKFGDWAHGNKKICPGT